MSTTSSTSGTLSSLGVGSGLDANSIVTKLVELERQPITLLQKRTESLQTKISAFGQIQSSVSSLRDAARKLANPDIWGTTKATVADTSVASFSTSSGAQTGDYSIQVTNLAAAQSVVTKNRVANSAATVGSGTLTFDKGNWSGTSFTASGSPVSVTIDAGDSLEKIRDKINQSGAPVLASIVTDSGGARLVMTSRTTGAEGGFRIQATDSDGNSTDDQGLSSLAFDLDPATATSGTDRTREAKDALAKINGVEVTSKTNTFSDVLPGISFTVLKEGASSNVSVAQDNDTISKAITDFATSFSSLITMLRSNTKYDDATKTAGTLQGDGTAVSILNQFRSIIGSSSGASSVFATLSSIGVEMQSGGTLTVNSTKLTNALGKLSEVKKLFSNVDNLNSANDGVATKLRALADNMLGFEGAITNRTAGLNKAVQDNQKREDEMDARVALYEKRLRAQYTALDKQMSQISGTSSYVTQMITNWNKSS
ncbi:MAG: flagellar filament capping protein FliD [Aquabacterium sp.]